MGRRGPPKTPTAIKDARQTMRKDRDTPDAAHGLKPVCPPPPAHLSVRAKAAWRTIGPKLAKYGLMTELDAIALEVLCTAYAETLTAAGQLKTKDLVILAGQNGTPMANPLVGIIGKNLTTLRWALGRFGMTPADRSGIKASNKQDAVDEMDELLNG